MVFQIKLSNGDGSPKKTAWIGLPASQQELISVIYELMPYPSACIKIEGIKDCEAFFRPQQVSGYSIFELNMLAQAIEEMNNKEVTFLNTNGKMFRELSVIDIIYTVKTCSAFDSKQEKIFTALINDNWTYADARNVIVHQAYRIFNEKNDFAFGFAEVQREGGIENLSDDILMEYFDYAAYGAAQRKERGMYKLGDNMGFVEVMG